MSIYKNWNNDWNIEKLIYSNIEKLVLDQEKLFFNYILPTYIDKYFFGKGYYFVKRILYDLDNRAKFDISQTETVPQKSIMMSKKISYICPIELSIELKLSKNKRPILGQFIHESSYVSSGFVGLCPSEYKTIYSIKKVVIYLKSFSLIESKFKSERRFKEKILETVMYEYIHFFESFFLENDEQELSYREANPNCYLVNRLSVNKAIRKDIISVILRYIKYSFMVFIILILIWTVIDFSKTFN